MGMGGLEIRSARSKESLHLGIRSRVGMLRLRRSSASLYSGYSQHDSQVPVGILLRLGRGLRGWRVLVRGGGGWL